MIIAKEDKKLSIKVVGYEFPDAKPDVNGFDYDANWLNCEICYTEGKTERSRNRMFHYIELMKAMFMDVNPLPVKKAMSFMGYCNADVP